MHILICDCYNFSRKNKINSYTLWEGKKIKVGIPASIPTFYCSPKTPGYAGEFRKSFSGE